MCVSDLVSDRKARSTCSSRKHDHIPNCEHLLFAKRSSASGHEFATKTQRTNLITSHIHHPVNQLSLLGDPDDFQFGCRDSCCCVTHLDHQQHIAIVNHCPNFKHSCGAVGLQAQHACQRHYTPGVGPVKSHFSTILRPLTVTVVLARFKTTSSSCASLRMFSTNTLSASGHCHSTASGTSFLSSFFSMVFREHAIPECSIIQDFCLQ